MVKSRPSIGFVLLFLFSCNFFSSCAQTPAALKIKPDKPEYPTDHLLTSKERKDVTDNFLKARKVPVLANLPFVEDHANARFRPGRDVARRCVILYGLINVAGKNKTAAYMVAYFKKYGLWPDVSPSEKKYLLNVPAKQETIDMSWRMESLNVLFWSLGHFETLHLPIRQCDFSRYSHLPNLDENPQKWIEVAELRDKEEILNEADLIYRIHWATTEASLQNKSNPYNFDSAIVYERHYALNWLIMYADNWDDITTDT